MPTTVTKSIGTSSRDYSTLQAWEDAAPADLVADDKIWRGECYNDSEFLITSGTALSVSGSTTDATRYKELTAASGQSFQDHANIRTSARTYDVSLGVGIRSSAAFQHGVYASEDYFRCSRIQVTVTSGSSLSCLNVANSGGVYADILAYRQDGAYSYAPFLHSGSFKTATFINCLGIAGSDSTWQGCFTGGGSCIFIGCTAIRLTNMGAAYVGFSQGFGTTALLISCASFGWTTPCTAGAFDTTNSKNNATDAASGLPGSNNVHSVTYSSTTPFTLATVSGLDMRPVAATALAGAGYLDATNAPNDITKFARANPPTIGAEELAGGGSPSVSRIKPPILQAVNRAATY